MHKSLRSSAVLLSLAFTGTIAGTICLIGATASYSQEPQGPPPGQHPGFGHRGPNAKFETEMLTKRLGLSQEQSGQVETILTQQDESLKALRPAPGTQPDFKALQESRKAIMEESKTELAKVFSSEQFAEYEKMHRHHGPPPGGPHGNWQGKSGTGN